MTCRFKRVELEQGSSEWLDARKRFIGASEVHHLFNLKYSNPLELALQKLGLASPAKPNYAMKRGTRLEPFARRFAELQLGCEFEGTEFVLASESDRLIASLDGLGDGYVLEIKSPGAKTLAWAALGYIPAYYWIQVQQQMLAAGVEHAVFVAFDGAFNLSPLSIPIHRSATSEIIERGERFFNILDNWVGEYKSHAHTVWEQFKVRPDYLEHDWIKCESVF